MQSLDLLLAASDVVDIPSDSLEYHSVIDVYRNASEDGGYELIRSLMSYGRVYRPCRVILLSKLPQKIRRSDHLGPVVLVTVLPETQR